MITLKPIRDDLVEYEQTLGMQESECRCEDVTMYDDGFCECNGCGYQWYEE